MSFRNNATIWEKSPMLRLLPPLVSGILWYDKFGIPATYSTGIFIISVAVFVCFIGTGIYSFYKRKWNVVQFLVTQVMIFILGAGICYSKDDRRDPHWMGNQAGSAKTIAGVVATPPLEKSKTIKYEIKALKALDDKGSKPITGTAFVYLYKKGFSGNIQLGDTILVPDKWQSINNSGNPFGFNYRQYCRRRNIFYQQFLSPAEISVYAKQNPEVRSVFQKIQEYCMQSIAANIRDTTAQALLKAMLVGDERDIDPDTRQAYSDTGIIHIVSISGAHVAMLFFAIRFCLRWIRNPQYEWIKFIAALLLVWVYVLIAGASTPALRAAIMFTLLVIGYVRQYQGNPLNQLLTTAFVLLLFQPMWLFNIGFQLSFIAVLSLLVFYQPLIALWQPKNRMAHFMAKAIAASIAAEILVAPLVAYYFNSFPPLFILANVLASFAMGALLALGMILLLIGKIAVLAKTVSAIIVWGSQGFHYCIKVLQCFNIAALKALFFTVTDLVLLYVFIVFASIFILKKRKHAVWPALFSMLVFSFLCLHRTVETQTQQKIIVFNDNHEGHCELLKGNTYATLRGNEVETYSSTKAHIGFGTSKKTIAPDRQVFLLQHKKILFIDSNTKRFADFPVDVLVINAAHRYTDPVAIIKSLSPKQIVLVNNRNQWYNKEWLIAGAAGSVMVHNIKTDGAFVFP